MSSKPTPSSPADPVRESAHQIWLAGLGAFNKAQEEGGKMFDALVQEGLAMQRKAQASAEEKLTEAGEKLNAMSQQFGERAAGQWDKLESLFEERVARALQRLGIPSSQEMRALRARVAELEQQLASRSSSRAATKPTNAAKKATPRKAAAKKAPVRKAAPRKPAA